MSTEQHPFFGPGVRSEPAAKKRLDLRIETDAGTLWIDVSTTHVLASTCIRQAAMSAGGAAEGRERLKHNHYPESAFHEGGQDRGFLLAFVVENYGRLGPEADKVLRLLHQPQHPPANFSSQGFVQRFQMRLAVLLQRFSAQNFQTRYSALFSKAQPSEAPLSEDNVWVF